jgi:hypothetical protein
MKRLLFAAAAVAMLGLSVGASQADAQVVYRTYYGPAWSGVYYGPHYGPGWGYPTYGYSAAPYGAYYAPYGYGAVVVRRPVVVAPRRVVRRGVVVW